MPPGPGTAQCLDSSKYVRVGEFTARFDSLESRFDGLDDKLDRILQAREADALGDGELKEKVRQLEASRTSAHGWVLDVLKLIVAAICGVFLSKVKL